MAGRVTHGHARHGSKTRICYVDNYRINNERKRLNSKGGRS